jgi:Plasmid pRiA4b ORF-3-like protein.
MAKTCTQKTNLPILQIKINLLETAPLVWRRVMVREDMNLGVLHAIIQIAMGWTNSHLHHFLIDGKRYVDPALDQDRDFSEGEESIDENAWTLLDLLRPDITQFEYEYDFGDSWRHLIIVERIENDSAGFQDFALCLAGERACPPEDCGGVGGFANILEIIKNPEHEEYKSMIEWLGKKYNPASFDVGKTNRYLKKLKWECPTIEQLGKILEARDGYRE